ncbi:DUF5082 family protein [Metabacillus herbersteinensis]|uniref:DUF5082 family protein n=1 Tax=Metabacillus herbersteinensis TaxID=283816 RepID=A0ABV6GG94_9BACI
MGIEQLSSQIHSVHSTISYLNQDVHQKREQLERLIQCNQQLLTLHEDLFSILPSIRRPELHSQNWVGSNAQEFEDLRETSIVNQFHQLLNYQYSNLEQALEVKITEIKNELNSLESRIYSQQTRLSQLESRRKEMLTYE